MVYFRLKRQEDYRELGAEYLDQIDRERTAKRLVKQLTALGYEVQTVDLEIPRGEEKDRKSPDPPLPLAA